MADAQDEHYQQTIPPMTKEIDEYIHQLEDMIRATSLTRGRNQRTDDYSVINFADTKQDRLWRLKVNDELIDAVLTATDGQQERVHMDMVFALKPSKPFWKVVDKGHSSVAAAEKRTLIKQYTLDSAISSALLHELVFFAYHHKCALTDANAMSMAKIGAEFEIVCLVHYCLDYLVDHCSSGNVIKAFELASQEQFQHKAAKAFFQKYIEDNFEQIWQSNKFDLLSLNLSMLSTVLKWDKLNIQSEAVLWGVIQEWIKHALQDRIYYLPELIQECLRFGRLSQTYIADSIFGSDIFVAMEQDEQFRVKHSVQKVLQSPERKLVIKDGYRLLYSKTVTQFRPRETKQLLLAAGGWVDGKTTQLIEMYDYQSNLWLSSSVKLSVAVSYFGFELVGSVVYVFGGSNGREIFNSCYALDLTSKNKSEWMIKSTMGERRCYLSSTVLDGQIYAIGGFNTYQRSRKCERYDPKEDRWTDVADLNLARSDASTVAHKGRIYIAGGINDAHIEQSVEVYYPEQNQWIMVKAMDSPRTSFAIAHFNDRIWAIGGNDGIRRLNSCESYDPETDSWKEERSMITGRSTFKAIEFNGQLFAVGGYNGQSPICNVEKYIPNQGWTKVRHLRHERSGMALLAIPNIFNLFKL